MNWLRRLLRRPAVTGSTITGWQSSAPPRRPGGRGWFSRWRRSPRPTGRTPQQLEMLLGGVRPVRNPLLDDDVEVVKRSRSRLIYETKPAPGAQRAHLEEESNRAWERLRGRQLDRLKVPAE